MLGRLAHAAIAVDHQARRLGEDIGDDIGLLDLQIVRRDDRHRRAGEFERLRRPGRRDDDGFGMSHRRRRERAIRLRKPQVLPAQQQLVTPGERAKHAIEGRGP